MIEELPAVLEPFVETHEEHGPAITTCGCGATQVITGQKSPFWQACESGTHDAWDLLLTTDDRVSRPVRRSG